ncbi:ATP-binding protein [Modestobacter sp. I12A-02628]|uniref:ATP-binding protein n=1 Tax=Goekera deserti TaxID=2497753 RepID=A0A7K3WIA3_9ACTN|nr:ATP-binding protein [Goekera deserti]MPQ96412.1 ATP-binding protein [Goekera deserti]NDI47276.1 ATP-binding protein [Goekera deserti]NEL56106.1 ATP-binding protein [Goekera deserti]
MRASLWQRARPPAGYDLVWRRELHSLPQLAGLRAALRTTLTGSAVVLEPELDHWSERMVLVVDELASNALRHGAPPVDAVLSRRGEDWMIAVEDSSGDVPPTPAEGRDPARGGFGLYLVADLTSAHGWCAEQAVKTVWAVVHGVD